MSRAKIFIITVIFIGVGAFSHVAANVSVYEEIWNTGYDDAKLPSDAIIGPLQDYADEDGAYFGTRTTEFFENLAKGTLNDNMFLPGSRLILRRNLNPLEQNIYEIETILIGEIMRVRTRSTVPFRLILTNGNSQKGEIFFEQVAGEWYISGISALDNLIIRDNSGEGAAQ